MRNPKLSTEDFATLWETQDQYANFRNVINRYRRWIDEAYGMEGRQDSIVAWQRIFGEEFAKGDVVKAAADSMSDGVSRSLSE